MGDMVTSKDIGLKIKALRQQAGLSQEKLAELVGVTFQQVQKYENSQTTLNVIKLQLIADALKVPVTVFFSGEATDQHARLTDEEDDLLQAYRRIKNGELRGCVLRLVANVNKRVK
jgi:transcriptional regulator with XRE-family HTH domain